MCASIFPGEAIAKGETIQPAVPLAFAHQT